ncbi:MAG TPA: glycine--tRNA ligase subunit beta [Rhizomicrobium sp.]|nr:glycine--tRNA ligase subunit beta [Rhizomicrobium sp.]
MSDLLLELFSEEIPARMQAQAARDLERLVVGALSDRGLLFEGVKAFAGPRRLTLTVSGLPAKQSDVSEEKKGPRVGAPDKAVQGFLRSAGVKLEDCETRNDGKGEFYVAVIQLKGRATADVIAEFLPEVLAKLPWPKSMRWPQASNTPVRWVRPLHSILCTLDGEVVAFTFAGVTSGNTTKGHRFLSSGMIAAKRFDDYAKKLRAAHVILDAEERKAIIFEGVKQAAFVHGLEMIPDEGLLDEVAGLAEWPVVLIGAIEDQFMDVPAEILQTAMRTHQKYFSLRDPKSGKFANRFALVANMVAEDGGKQIVAGNERVLRARLSDAKFFWDQDRKTRLEDRVNALANIVFHAKLGTQLERVERIEALAGEIAEKIGADVKKAKRAARLCKADLTTGVVGEFPELQGVMGRYYALNDGQDAEVADAIRDHYKPLGPNDAVPTSKVAIAVALADKLEQLTDFFAVDEKPSGSGDPFALRRAALGFIRVVLENKVRLNVFSLVRAIFDKNLQISSTLRADGGDFQLAMNVRFHRFLVASSLQQRTTSFGHEEHDKERLAYRDFIFRHISNGLLAFLADRMAVALRERGTRYDLVNAVFSLGDQDDLVRLVARVEALQAFLKTDEGANLLAGYKRAANILKAEEKKDGAYDGEPDPEAFVLAEEKALFVELATASELIKAEIERERFTEAMGVMARLRGPVDAFFDKVTVNDKDAGLRKNRLLLLSRLRATLHTVADFSKIEGG